MNKKIMYSIIGALVLIIAAGLIYTVMKRPAAAVVPNDGTGATTTPQVAAEEIKEGTGAQATPGSQVSVLYVGKLENGTVFDSSAMHDNVPYTFTLGSTEAGSPIPGFQIGVNGMKEGGIRKMTIPADLAYGAQEIKGPDGTVVIPANTALVFEVQLVKVTAPAATPAQQ
jgi:FKBP-type peptidyl-prolyl cis-trans isomerase